MPAPLYAILVGSKKHPQYDGKFKAHLLEFGIEVKWSWYKDANTRDWSTTLKKADLMIVTVDQCSHPLDRKCCAAAKKAKLPHFRMDHHWATAAAILTAAGYKRVPVVKEVIAEAVPEVETLVGADLYQGLSEPGMLVLPIVARYPTISVKPVAAGPMATYKWSEQRVRMAIYEAREALGLVCSRKGRASPMEVEFLDTWEAMRALLAQDGYQIDIPKKAMKVLLGGAGKAGTALPNDPFPPAFVAPVQAPIQEPVEEAPMKETPVEETPVEETPAPTTPPELRVVPDPAPGPAVASQSALPEDVRVAVDMLLVEMRAHGITAISVAVPGGKAGTATLSWERIEMVVTKGKEVL